MTSRQKNGLFRMLKGGMAIAAGGFLSKILGAFYRVPLTNLLGADGLGLYQTAFPLYCMLLTFSSTGAPSAIAKLVSEDESASGGALKRAFSLFLPIGIAGSVFLAAFSTVISRLQGNAEAYTVYIALSPSIAAVSAISCLRGYFQGKKQMFPTAFSQVTEQAVKLIFGLSLCFFFGKTASGKAALATLAVSISEAVALGYLLIRFRREKPTGKQAKFSVKRLIAVVFPITLSTLLLPVARVYDSFTVINALSNYTDKATSLYGVYTGGVETIIGVPVAICYGLAVSALPNVSSSVAKGETEIANKKIGYALGFTMLLSSAAAIILSVGAPLLVNALFSGLLPSERDVMSELLKCSALNVVLLSLVQTETSCLIALGKNFAPCVFLGSGLLIKMILQPVLLKNPQINIFAPLISDIICYFVAVFGNLVYIIYSINARGKQNEDNFGGNRYKVGGYIARGGKRG